MSDQFSMFAEGNGIGQHSNEIWRVLRTLCSTRQRHLHTSHYSDTQIPYFVWWFKELRQQCHLYMNMHTYIVLQLSTSNTHLPILDVYLYDNVYVLYIIKRILSRNIFFLYFKYVNVNLVWYLLKESLRINGDNGGCDINSRTIFKWIK